MTFGVGIISLLLLLNTQIDNQLQKNLRGIDMVIGAKGIPLQLIPLQSTPLQLITLHLIPLHLIPLQFIPLQLIPLQ